MLGVLVVSLLLAGCAGQSTDQSQSFSQSLRTQNAVASTPYTQDALPDPSRSLRSLTARTRARLAYVLLGSGSRDDLLVSILKQLRDFLMPWTPGDVLFFHTGEYDTPDKTALVTKIIPSALILRIPEDAWTLPEGLHENDAPTWKYSKCCPFPMHGIGYRHMCRWYSIGLFRYLAGLGYKWVFRLDEDSEVLTPVKQNMMGWMESLGKQYAFRLWDEEDQDMIWSLPELTQWYLTANEIQPKWLYDSCRPRSSVGLNSHGGWNRRILYNNMFMTNITWWLTSEVQSYLRVVEQSQGFYFFRWGDAPIHTMVVRTFLTRSQVHVFGFSYCHKGNCDPQRHHYLPSLQDSPP